MRLEVWPKQEGQEKVKVAGKSLTVCSGNEKHFNSVLVSKRNKIL